MRFPDDEDSRSHRGRNTGFGTTSMIGCFRHTSIPGRRSVTHFHARSRHGVVGLGAYSGLQQRANRTVVCQVQSQVQTLKKVCCTTLTINVINA